MKRMRKMRRLIALLSILLLGALLFVPSGALAQIVSDSFVGAAGTVLESHTPTPGGSGAGWSSMGLSNVFQIDGAGHAYHTSAGAGAVDRSIEFQTSGSSVYTVTGTTTNDYTASVALTCVSNTFKDPGLVVRATAGGKQSYQMHYNGYWLLDAVDSGGNSHNLYQSAFGVSAPTGGVTQTITLTVSGSNPVVLTGKVGPTTIFTYSDSTYLYASGLAGICQKGGGGDNISAAGFYFSAFQVYTSTPPAATAYTLTGPTSIPFTGLSGTVTGPYSVSLTPAGGTAASTTISLSDGGAGGTFYSLAPSGASGQTWPAYTSLTSVTLSTASPSASFYYRNPNAGSLTITPTNSGTLTNPSALTQTFVADPYLRFMLVGDSITNYLSTNTYWMSGGSNTLTDRLGWVGTSTQRLVELYNEGHPGQTSGFWNSATAWNEIITDAGLNNARYVQLMAGTNDCNLGGTYAIPPSGAGLVTTSAAITATGSQTIAVSSTSKMVAGGLVSIEPQTAGNPANGETVTVTSITDGTHFVATLSKTHASGVSVLISPATTAAITTTGSQTINRHYRE